MSLMAYDHFSWDGAFASDWRWPAAGVLIYLVLVFLLGVAMKDRLGFRFSGWFFVLTLTWSWA